MFPFSLEASDLLLTRFLLQRAIALCYLVAFLIVLNQFCALSGEKGLMPVHHFLRGGAFWNNPSLFFFSPTDRAFQVCAWIGVLLSAFVLSGYSERFGWAISLGSWGLLWVLYLSFVNAGGTFYGFGWELLLCETGLLAIFLGPQNAVPSVFVIWLFRWLLFRLMFGAGMIKWRGDECWRSLTCMDLHYQTQPLPNGFSWFLHHAPAWFHKIETALTLFIEIIVPFFYFVPGPIAWIAGLITILFQGAILISGNLSWLNFLTIALALSCFDDRAYPWIAQFLPRVEAVAFLPHQWAVYALSAVTLFLSYRPAKNLLSANQVMIAAYNSFNYVNTYGLFGGITIERHEVILQGTDSLTPGSGATWREYQFKAKPGDLSRRPPQVSPYHYKLDWQMWFAAMSPYWENPWVLNLAGKLLEGDQATLSLLGHNPFPDKPPRFLRMELYDYRYTRPGDRGGNWWARTRLDTYLEPVSLDHQGLKEALSQLRHPE